MGIKKARMTIGPDADDIDFLDGLEMFTKRSDAIRFCIKLARLYTIPTIKAISEKEKD